MRMLFALLSCSILFLPFSDAQTKPQSIRLCVALVKNSSRVHAISPKWQRTQLIKDFERINKTKEVTKGKAAKIETVALDSTDEADPAVRENNCEFVLRTTLTDVQRTDVGQINVPTPGAIEIGRINAGDPRATPQDSNDATVTYDVLRNGDPESWSSGIVTARDSFQDEELVSQLMDQVARKVANDLRQPHTSSPQ
jgi:hypothetical protein